jgi:hypothetical protein
VNFFEKVLLLTFNSNVDRMLDLWSAIHPAESTDWLEHDPDAKVPLIPFRADQNDNYHTAQGVWRPESLGYTYPETQRWKPEYQTDGKFDENKLAAELTEILNKKYNSAAAAQRKALLTTTRDAPTDKTITSTEAAANEVAPSIHAQIVGEEVNGVAISALPEGQKESEVLPEVIEAPDYVANVVFEK